MQPCGLFISKSHNYLAASPDGLVYNADSTELNSSGLVEIKVVFLKENETLYQALIRKRIFLPGSTDGHLVINQKHKYHYHCSNIDVIYIVKYEVTSAISLAVSRGHLAIHCHLEKLLLLTKKANKLNLNLKCSNRCLFVTQKSWVDLVEKGVKDLPDRSIVDTEGVFISTVNFYPEFWSSVLPKLEAFYNEHILVELAYPRVKFGLSRSGLRGC